MCRVAASDSSRGGAQHPAPPLPSLFSDQTVARKGETVLFFLETGHPPYLRVWMTSPPLSQGLDPALAAMCFLSETS